MYYLDLSLPGMCNRNYSKLFFIHLSTVFLPFGYGWMILQYNSLDQLFLFLSGYGRMILQCNSLNQLLLLCHQVPNHIFTTFMISYSRWDSKLWNCFLKQFTNSYLLFVVRLRWTILCKKQSLPPWITNPQLTKLWCSSLC